MSISESYPVVIVGGGPVGLISSIMLSRLGVKNVVFERHRGTAIAPRAVGFNQRTAEIFRFLGLIDEIRTKSAPARTVGRTAWHTSLAGPTPLHGRQIAIKDAWGGGQYEDEYAAASPEAYIVIPQLRLEPILKRVAESYANAHVFFNHEVTSVVTDAQGATVEVDSENGRSTTVSARYVIAADAGRTVASQLGIKYEGQDELVDLVSAHVSAEIAPHLPQNESLVHWFINPDLGGSIGSGYLAHIGPWDARGHSEEWLFFAASIPGDPVQFDEDGVRRRMQRSLGLPDLDIQVNSISHWVIQMLLADRFREESVFLVGDAAHRVPPWGGLGLNTGIQDAHNLTWKLAAALADTELESLLDSYETERRRIAENIADVAWKSFQGHGQVLDRALGLAPGLSPEEGWAALGELWADGEAGNQRREALAAALKFLDHEFHAHGTEVGFSYPEGVLLPEVGSSEDSFGQLEYVPSSAPGHHVPHAWVEHEGAELSTIELAGNGRWALIVDGELEIWQASLDSSESPLSHYIDIFEVGPNCSYRDVRGEWSGLREVGPSGAILVRPDTFVAWRADSADRASELPHVLVSLGTTSY